MPNLSAFPESVPLGFSAPCGSTHLLDIWLPSQQAELSTRANLCCHLCGWSAVPLLSMNHKEISDPGSLRKPGLSRNTYCTYPGFEYLYFLPFGGHNRSVVAGGVCPCLVLAWTRNLAVVVCLVALLFAAYAGCITTILMPSLGHDSPYNVPLSAIGLLLYTEVPCSSAQIDSHLVSGTSDRWSYLRCHYHGWILGSYWKVVKEIA